MALRYTAKISGATGMAVMLLDVLAGLDELKVCTAYRLNGETLHEFPADPDDLAKVEPVYETLPGFVEPVDGCRRFEDLPAAARGYLERIEREIGVPVVMASVGPARDQSMIR